MLLIKFCGEFLPCSYMGIICSVLSVAFLEEIDAAFNLFDSRRLESFALNYYADAHFDCLFAHFANGSFTESEGVASSVFISVLEVDAVYA